MLTVKIIAGFLRALGSSIRFNQKVGVNPFGKFFGNRRAIFLA